MAIIGSHFVKEKISALVSGEYVENGDESFLRTKDGTELLRVRLLGTVVEKYVANDKNYAALTVDDSTETIRAKFFREAVSAASAAEIGDSVDIFGFVRKYEGEIYIAPMICKKITDSNFEVLRKLELAAPQASSSGVSNLDIESKILMKIAELDSGDGVKMDALADSLKLENDAAIEAIGNLLIKGELYEPKKGIVKRVE